MENIVFFSSNIYYDIQNILSFHKIDLNNFYGRVIEKCLDYDIEKIINDNINHDQFINNENNETILYFSKMKIIHKEKDIFDYEIDGYPDSKLFFNEEFIRIKILCCLFFFLLLNLDNFTLYLNNHSIIFNKDCREYLFYVTGMYTTKIIGMKIIKNIFSDVERIFDDELIF